MKEERTLKIADVIIRIRSDRPMRELGAFAFRFENFLYKGTSAPDIHIRLDIVDKLPEVENLSSLFVTYHFEDGNENWRFRKQGDTFIYCCPLEDKEQVAFVNKTFDDARIYVLPKENRRAKAKSTFEKTWALSDVVYDFLQVLLINHLASRKGTFVHSIGLKDKGGHGILFPGISGAGKSTTARLWARHSKAMVLNDDRMIIRKIKEKFYIYGTPWHGDFSDYLKSAIEKAELKKILFIHHAKKNIARPLDVKEAFTTLYTCIFLAFGDKSGLNNAVSFCLDLVQSVPAFRFGFTKDKSSIAYARDV